LQYNSDSEKVTKEGTVKKVLKKIWKSIEKLGKTGSWSWIISQSVGNAYTIEVEDAPNFTIYDRSDSNFAIVTQPTFVTLTLTTSGNGTGTIQVSTRPAD